MSHHLDSPLARQDVRLDITDLYVFRGRQGTVFVLNVNNSIAGADAPQGFHPEAQYVIKLDLNGDAVEDLSYRLTFGARDAAGRQSVELRQLIGREAADPARQGVLLAQGSTNTTIEGAGGVRLWAGLAHEPFYIDPTVLKAVGAAFKTGQRVELGDWRPDHAVNLFAGTTINAIVIEAPDSALLPRLGPAQRIAVWAVSLLATDTGDWRPINRAGRPMMQPIFNPDDSEAASEYNTTAPADDLANYGERFARQVAQVVAAHETAADPSAYGNMVAAMLLPDRLSYDVGTAACYGFASQNGRALTDNTPDVMFSLVTNTPLAGGLSPANMTGKPSEMFPYVAIAGA